MLSPPLLGWGLSQIALNIRSLKTVQGPTTSAKYSQEGMFRFRVSTCDGVDAGSPDPRSGIRPHHVEGLGRSNPEATPRPARASKSAHRQTVKWRCASEKRLMRLNGVFRQFGRRDLPMLGGCSTIGLRRFTRV